MRGSSLIAGRPLHHGLHCCCAHLLVSPTGDSEAVLDRDGEPVVLAAASRHKPDEAHELARIRSKVRAQAVSTLRDLMMADMKSLADQAWS